MFFCQAIIVMFLLLGPNAKTRAKDIHVHFDGLMAGKISQSFKADLSEAEGPPTPEAEPEPEVEPEPESEPDSKGAFYFSLPFIVQGTVLLHCTV